MSYIYTCPVCGTPTHCSAIRNSPQLCKKCLSLNGNDRVDTTTLRPWDSVTERDAYIADQRDELRRLSYELSDVKRERNETVRLLAKAQKEEREALAQMCQAIGYLSTIAGDCEAWLNGESDETSMEFIKAIRDYAKRYVYQYKEDSK